MKKLATVIDSRGVPAFNGVGTFKHGDNATRLFAARAGLHTEQKGVSIMVAADATPEAIHKAISYLKLLLP